MSHNSDSESSESSFNSSVSSETKSVSSSPDFIFVESLLKGSQTPQFNYHFPTCIPFDEYEYQEEPEFVVDYTVPLEPEIDIACDKVLETGEIAVSEIECFNCQYHKLDFTSLRNCEIKVKINEN